MINFRRNLKPNEALGIGKKAKYKEEMEEWLNSKEIGIIPRHEKNKKICSSMRIIHLDAIEEISKDQLFYINDIISKAEDDPVAMGIYYLSNQVPIFLVSEKKMKLFRGIKDDKNLSIELLGWYQRVSDVNTQVIYICLDGIIDAAHNMNEKNGAKPEEIKKYLIAKVIIHELAHALMDHPTFKFQGNGVEKMTEFNWIEEPMANAFALRLAKLAGENTFFYELVRSFIRTQPPEYKLGEYFFTDIDKIEDIIWLWRSWAEKKHKWKKENYPTTKDDIDEIRKCLKS